MNASKTGLATTKVLLVAEQLRRAVPGGIGTYVRGLVDGLGRLDDDAGTAPDVTLYASRPGPGPDPLASLPAPTRFSVLPAPVMTRSWDSGLLDVPRGYPVVHASSVLTPPSRHASLAVTVHDLAWRHAPDAYPRRGRRWHESALRRALRRADAVVVPSDPVAEETAAEGVDRARIHVMPHGSDHLPPPDDAGAGSLLAALGVHGPFLLSVGTLEPRKNVGRLVEAYRAARPRLPEPWPLVVVGPRGWGRRAGEADAVPGVMPTGVVSGGVLAALYQRARLLVYVPLLEGFGFPPLEAMVSGCPVVASAMPSTGEAAFDVDPRDVEAMAEALLEVATDESVRARLADRGRAHAALHTWAASARRHARLWASLA